MSTSIPTRGQRIADAVCNTIGSWPFIMGQTVFLASWIITSLAGITAFDAFPFILLNLMLSIQAGYTAPFILMAQGRQSAIDRQTIEHTLWIDAKAMERIDEIERKIDHLTRGFDRLLSETIPSA